MKSKAATPRPWKANENGVLETSRLCPVPIVSGVREEAFDDPSEDGALLLEEAKANSALIEMAVNSHEALLESLRTIANRGGVDLDYATIGNIARQAIAQAEGGK